MALEGIARLIDAPLATVFNALTDLSFRHEWQPGLEGSDQLNHAIAQGGSTHRCVIKHDDSDPFWVAHDFDVAPDRVTFTETERDNTDRERLGATEGVINGDHEDPRCTPSSGSAGSSANCSGSFLKRKFRKRSVEQGLRAASESTAKELTRGRTAAPLPGSPRAHGHIDSCRIEGHGLHPSARRQRQYGGLFG